MKVNLFLVLCLCAVIWSCKKSDSEPDISPSQYPTVSFDKTKIKSAYAIGDSVDFVVNFKDNGYGQIKTLYTGLQVNYSCKYGSCGTPAEQGFDSLNVNPPSTSVNYHFKWKVKNIGTSNYNLKSGDSVFVVTDIRYLNKKYGYGGNYRKSPVFTIK